MEGGGYIPRIATVVRSVPENGKWAKYINVTFRNTTTERFDLWVTCNPDESFQKAAVHWIAIGNLC